MECSVCSRHCSRYCKIAVNKTDQNSVLMKLTFYRGFTSIWVNSNRGPTCQALLTRVGKPHQDSLRKDAEADQGCAVLYLPS